MNDPHAVHIEAHFADDISFRRIGLTVTCACGVLLLEIEGNDEVQTTLDFINEARFAHYEDIAHREPVCEVCGDCGE